LIVDSTLLCAVVLKSLTSTPEALDKECQTVFESGETLHAACER
jgi:hypothetical protein